tara:strand:- start:85 stop:444 length:360 start_codon:yes stop_codon:yes gene_type:complete
MFSKKINKIFSSCILLTVTSCGPSDVIVNIYGVAEYNCSKEEYRILTPMPMLSFLKIKKWYNRDEFHKANYKEAFEPYKDLAISEETLLEVLPTPEKSDAFFNEFTMLVDCENPKDIKF